MSKVRFHVVYSVKGGCGKTAFSLFKAMELAAAEEAPCAEVLFLDADFKGSGLKTLIYAKDQETYDASGKGGGVRRLEEIEGLVKELKLKKRVDMNSFLFRQEYRKKTMNDYLMGNCETLSEIITEGAVIHPDTVVENIGFNGYLDFIFCSSRNRDKKPFRYENGEQAALNVGLFRLRMRSLLKAVCCHGADDGRQDKEDGQYKDVVIDMPPGDDGYATVLLELLRRFIRDRKQSDELYYYVLTTGDRSHLDVAEETLKRALYGSPDVDPYTKIFLIFNEVHEDEFLHCNKARLKEGLGAEGSEIVEVTNKYQKEYYLFCREDTRCPFGYEFEM